MKPEEALIDALLREQARGHRADDDMLAAIEAAIDREQAEGRRKRPRWHRALPLSIAAGLAMGGAAIYHQTRDVSTDLALGPPPRAEEGTTTGAPGIPEAMPMARMSAEAPVADAAVPVPASPHGERADAAILKNGLEAGSADSSAMTLGVVTEPETVADSVAHGEIADGSVDPGIAAALRTKSGGRHQRSAESRAMSPLPADRDHAKQRHEKALASDSHAHIDPADLPWKSPWQAPRSSFPVHVETGSYPALRRMILDDRPIPAEAVRIEELIHHFSYRYAAPDGSEPLAAASLLTSCPWQEGHLLARVTVRAGDTGKTDPAGPVALASDANAEVEFNPGKVKAYRLIGYTAPPTSGGNSGGSIEAAAEIFAGHSVTALYEIVPVGVAGPGLSGADDLRYQRPADRRELIESDEWFTFKLSHTTPGHGGRRLIQIPTSGEPTPWEEAGTDFRMAAAVALFGLKLRGTEGTEKVGWDRIVEIARPALSDDPDGRRADFLRLLEHLDR